MGINHKIGTCITEYLVGQEYDVADIHCAKICYAVESLVGDLQKNLLLFFVFAISGFFREFLFCFLTVNLVRRFLGGIHMKTNIGCTVVSISVYVLAVVGGTLAPVSQIVTAGLILVVAYLMIKIAPLPSPNRPVYKGERKRKIQIRGLLGLAALSICITIFPACAAFVGWTLVLQIVEAGVVLLREDYMYYQNQDAPMTISAEAEKLFMDYTRNYEQRLDGLVRYPANFEKMTRKERTSAFKGFSDSEKDAFLALLTDEEKNRLVQDIHYQAVHDFWKRQ